MPGPGSGPPGRLAAPARHAPGRRSRGRARGRARPAHRPPPPARGAGRPRRPDPPPGRRPGHGPPPPAGAGSRAGPTPSYLGGLRRHGASGGGVGAEPVELTLAGTEPDRRRLLAPAPGTLVVLPAELGGEVGDGLLPALRPEQEQSLDRLDRVRRRRPLLSGRRDRRTVPRSVPRSVPRTVPRTVRRRVRDVGRQPGRGVRADAVCEVGCRREGAGRCGVPGPPGRRDHGSEARVTLERGGQWAGPGLGTTGRGEQAHARQCRGRRRLLQLGEHLTGELHQARARTRRQPREALRIAHLVLSRPAPRNGACLDCNEGLVAEAARRTRAGAAGVSGGSSSVRLHGDGEGSGDAGSGGDGRAGHARRAGHPAARGDVRRRRPRDDRRLAARLRRSPRSARSRCAAARCSASSRRW